MRNKGDDFTRIRFKILPGLPYGGRMGLAAVALAGGVLIQLQPLPLAVAWGGPFVLFGILLTMAASKTNDPGALRGEKTWEQVTAEEFARIRNLVERGKRWARQDAFGAVGLRGCGTMLLLLTALLAGWVIMTANKMTAVATVWAADGGVFLVLTFFSGVRRVWQPPVMTKIDILQHILVQEAARPTPRLNFQPMLEVQKDAQKGQLPTDARILVSIDGAPADLIGFQIQCSINDVSGTKHPYLYTVIIARKAFRLEDRVSNTVAAPQDVLTLEHADAEVDVLVIRQKTTKTSGYSTSPADTARILAETTAIALALAGPAPV